MSLGAPGTPASTGLPPVNQALEPAWVRDGSPATKKAYSLAQNFEEVLVQELSQSMATTSGLGGEEESSTTTEAGDAPGTATSPMTSELSSMLPQALSSGVMSAGGLGLADQLTQELQPPSQPASVTPDGGTKA